VTWTIVSLCGCIFRRFTKQSSTRHLTQIALTLFLLYVGFTIAYGALGLDFNQLFIGSAFVTAAFVLASGSYMLDFIAGIQLHWFGLLDRHEFIIIEKKKCVLRGIGVLTTEFYEQPSEEEKNAKITRTFLIANRLLIGNTALEVEWEDERSSKGPPESSTSFVRAVARARIDVESNDVVEPPQARVRSEVVPVSAADFSGLSQRRFANRLAHSSRVSASDFSFDVNVV